jgi:hypothetical protein
MGQTLAKAGDDQDGLLDAPGQHVPRVVEDGPREAAQPTISMPDRSDRQLIEAAVLLELGQHCANYHSSAPVALCDVPCLAWECWLRDCWGRCSGVGEWPRPGPNGGRGLMS